MERAAQSQEQGYVLGVGLIAILVAQLLAMIFADVSCNPRLNELLTGTYLVSLGCMFLACYYYSHKSFFLRWLMWLCERTFRTARRKSAFFYFTLLVFGGSMMILGSMGVLGDKEVWRNSTDRGACAMDSRFRGNDVDR